MQTAIQIDLGCVVEDGELATTLLTGAREVGVRAHAQEQRQKLQQPCREELRVVIFYLA